MAEDQDMTHMIDLVVQETINVAINRVKILNPLIEMIQETTGTGRDGMKMTGPHQDLQVIVDHQDQMMAIDQRVRQDQTQDKDQELAMIEVFNLFLFSVLSNEIFC